MEATTVGVVGVGVGVGVKSLMLGVVVENILEVGLGISEVILVGVAIGEEGLRMAVDTIEVGASVIENTVKESKN